MEENSKFGHSKTSRFVVEECAARDQIKRFMKLRWIGLEAEAPRLQLALRPVDRPGLPLLFGPPDTD